MNPRLTDREKEVLILLCQGMRNKEIAEKLGIEVRTAETHHEQINLKLLPKGNATAVRLLRRAIELGLVPCPCKESIHLPRTWELALYLEAAVDRHNGEREKV